MWGLGIPWVSDRTGRRPLAETRMWLRDWSGLRRPNAVSTAHRVLGVQRRDREAHPGEPAGTPSPHAAHFSDAATWLGEMAFSLPAQFHSGRGAPTDHVRHASDARDGIRTDPTFVEPEARRNDRWALQNSGWPDSGSDSSAACPNCRSSQVRALATNASGIRPPLDRAPSLQCGEHGRGRPHNTSRHGSLTSRACQRKRPTQKGPACAGPFRFRSEGSD